MDSTNSVYDFQEKNIKGESVSLSKYKGQVLLIVNTASQCGYTPQYTGLEELQKKYQSRGFTVLGFPCNQFGAQEPGTDDQIASFCSLNFGVTFPLFAKIDVNGKQADPLYEFLKSALPGVLGTEAIKWNFTKFLIDKKGEPVARFAPQTKPEEIAGKIEELLA